MRLALLTDLHANREALTACLAHAAQQKADQYAFTGDFVGYGADPAWVVDTVMDYVLQGAAAVQGNHDYSAVHATRPQMHAEARQVIEWTRGQLNAAHLAFLAGLPLTAERSLRATHSRMVFCGHVHTPALYRRADDGRMGGHTPVPGTRIAIKPQHQYLVIPGAVGQPRDGNCAACYAIYDDVARELTYFRVPYDHGAAARRVIAAGLPIVFAMRLIEGI
jgi:diadenosine tetraphosphatase ApaH/serine/threonine PP2A family protein phosphatase